MLPATRRHMCPQCREKREFEQPVCVDDHGGDCPEWVCVVCATALVVGFPVESPPLRARRASAA